MKVHTQFQVLKPDTINGNRVQVVTTYSSFDETEINIIADKFRNEIGAGIIGTIELAKEQGNE